MRLIFATIVAAATLSMSAAPALADGERGDDRGHGQYQDRDDNHRGGRYEHRGNRDHGYQRHQRRQYQHNDNRGARYWGPSARQWSRWDNNWGDAHRYARQWGFDRYDHNRGWQRGNTWYSSPNQWSDWGGWNWSFSVGTGTNNHYGQNNYNQNNYSHNNHANNGYQQQNASCSTYRTQDWVQGRRAIVTYVGCADRWGQVFEQPGTRQIERWGW